jgi:SH3-like domain-containing protein
MVASSFLDNYNRIVLSIRSQNSLIKPASTESSMANAGGSTKAEAPQKSGEVLLPKIANVKVYKEPTRDSKVLATLPRGEELVATGEMENGFVQIDAANVSGWVQRTLVAPAGGYR